MAIEINDLDTVLSVEKQIWNSDVVDNIAYQHNIDLLKLIGKLKSYEKCQKNDIVRKD